MARNYSTFALGKETTWDGLTNAMEAYLRHETATTGTFTPLFFFAPTTEPANPDLWQPLPGMAENTLIISIARHWDTTIVKALEHMKDSIGKIYYPGDTSIGINYTLPIADVYQQMNRAEINIYSRTGTHPDDPSFYFVRGEATMRAFDQGLRYVTRNKA